VTPGLRRALVVQAARLTFLAAARLAKATGNPPPHHNLIDVERLVVDIFRHPERDNAGPKDDAEPGEAPPT